MRIRKGAYSYEIRLVKIKDYERFSLYQIYRIEGKEEIPIYKETFNKEQLELLKIKGVKRKC